MPLPSVLALLLGPQYAALANGCNFLKTVPLNLVCLPLYDLKVIYDKIYMRKMTIAAVNDNTWMS